MTGPYSPLDCASFGLCSAPYIFQKSLKFLDKYNAEELHIKHIRYLDDLLFIGPKSRLEVGIPKIVALLGQMNFHLSPKSVLIPSKEIDFIGYSINNYSLNIKHSTIDKVGNKVNRI